MLLNNIRVIPNYLAVPFAIILGIIVACILVPLWYKMEDRK